MIIAWNVKTDSAILPEREAEEGEWAKFPNGVYKEYHTPVVIPDPIEPFAITITSVEGGIKHNTDFTSITVYKDDVVILSGMVGIPDTVLALPLSKKGEIDIMFPVEVIDGKFEAKIQFDSSGQYTYSNEEANLDLPEQVFSVDTIKIDVLKKVL